MNYPKIIDVSPVPPDGLPTYPMEDRPFWTVVGDDTPRYGVRDDLRSRDGKFHVGYSQYDTMTLELRDWPGDEFMYFIEGQVEITDANGNAKVYGPGDMLVMPRGFNGTWRQLSPIKKISAIYGWEEAD